jgi:lipopolysaccharide/colanic/teichoic acid biosynthesis glycosyltransferase
MSAVSYDRVEKRILDAIFAAMLLVLLSPLLIVLTLIVAFALGRPVMFVQQRPGRDGRPFPLRKFRTMLPVDPHDSTVRSDAERLTPFGRWLRKTSLDELPELWNVLTGDMSLVGPRPLLMEYLPLYTPAQRRRHEVRPGITGWAQVSGRNELCWEKRFELDQWYVDHQSLVLDIRILFLTARSVATARGISQSGHATMPPFKGSGH